MRTADIKVKGEYAFEQWRNGQEYRGIVLAVRQPRKVRNNYYGYTTYKDGVKVQIDGRVPGEREVLLLRPAQITRPWAEAEAERRQRAKWADEQEKRTHQFRTEQADKVWVLDQALQARGVPTEDVYVFGDAHPYLKAVGYVFDGDEDRSRSVNTTRSAIPNLDDVVCKYADPKVSFDVLLNLVAPPVVQA